MLGFHKKEFSMCLWAHLKFFFAPTLRISSIFYISKRYLIVWCLLSLMWKKFLILFFGFLFLAFLQVSFLPHFHITSWIFNFILIASLLFSFLEQEESYLGYWGAFWAGLFLDIFSPKPIGFYILILLCLTVFIKVILKKYIRPVIWPRQQPNKRLNSSPYGPIF